MKKIKGDKSKMVKVPRGKAKAPGVTSAGRSGPMATMPRGKTQLVSGAGSKGTPRNPKIRSRQEMEDDD